MDTNALLFLIAITFLAYTVKGLTGFGPALIVVPFFAIAAGVDFALPASAIFDGIAGFILLFTIYKQISWKFCIPLMIAMAAGSFIGANAVFAVSPALIRILIGGFIFLFAIYLWTEKEKSSPQSIPGARTVSIGGAAAGFFGGISGGMIGMSGPMLVIYLKYFFQKDFFRSQLIAIFLAENVVRTVIYYNGGLITLQNMNFLLYCLPALLLGLWLGHRLHLQISEKLFNRVVSVILILVSAKLLLL